MKARYPSCVLASFLVATLAWAGSNLTLSKSNLYRLTYASDLVSPAQAKALLAELHRMGPADEVRLKQWLPANFKRLGIARDRISKLIVDAPRRKLAQDASRRRFA